MRTAALVVALAIAGAAPGAAAGGDGFDREALAASQAAIGHSVGDYRLVDADGGSLHLADLRGKPLVVAFVYTACTGLCPTLVTSLGGAVDLAAEALGGASFNVLTIGFDSRNDTPPRMRAFAAAHGISRANWRVASGDAATIEGLAGDLGFRYERAVQGFDHIGQVSVIDGDGRVYRQIYGASFEPQALVEPLKELVFGRRAPAASLTGLLDRIRLVCTLYDPASGTYRFDYSIFIGIVVGALSLGTTAYLLIRAWWRSARARRPA